MWIRNQIQGTNKFKFSHEKYTLCMEFGINHTYKGTKSFLKGFGILFYSIIVAYFLDPGSRSAFPIRIWIRIQENRKINRDPYGSGSTTLLFGKSVLLC
jgi:hypothetical protein